MAVRTITSKYERYSYKGTYTCLLNNDTLHVHYIVVSVHIPTSSPNVHRPIYIYIIIIISI